MANMFKFMREVRSETEKVTWPSRKEVIANTIMVFILVSLFAVFLRLVDSGLAAGIKAILGLGA